jgi:hypothetical protein
MKRMPGAMLVLLAPGVLAATADQHAMAVKVTGVVKNMSATDSNNTGLDGVTVEVFAMDGTLLDRQASEIDGEYTLDAPEGRVRCKYQKAGFLDDPTPEEQTVKNGQRLKTVRMKKDPKHEGDAQLFVRNVIAEAQVADQPVGVVFKAYWTWTRASGLPIERKQDVALAMRAAEPKVAAELPALAVYTSANRNRLIEAAKLVGNRGWVPPEQLMAAGLPKELLPDLCSGWLRQMPEERREAAFGQVKRAWPAALISEVEALRKVTQPDLPEVMRTAAPGRN